MTGQLEQFFRLIEKMLVRWRGIDPAQFTE